MQYNTSSSSIASTTTLPGSDWIRITTTQTSGASSNGWYSVNWGPAVSKEKLDTDQFYSPELHRYLNKSKVIIPELIKPCWSAMFDAFPVEKRDVLVKLFNSKEDAIFVLMTFHTSNPLEKKLFLFLAKNVYQEELNARN